MTSAAQTILTPSTGRPPVDAALRDLRRDLDTVLPSSRTEEPWTLHVGTDTALAPETFILEITADRCIAIHGGDDLGLIYGIYEFSDRFLGVDPLWFWKGLDPAPLASFAPPPQRIESGTPAFRWRGWFINDEDLLGRWRESGNSRFADWPKRAETLALPMTADNYERRLLEYYTPVVAPEVMEMVFEALLRLRGNLIIPASFTDIFNEPEAEIIRGAVRRGLFVSQHHVEPLGVSHFAYESWWGRQGKAPSFSYREDRQAMRECWRAHAERWSTLAGDRLVWQVGLRGRGDRPLWSHDPQAQELAGEFISGALADQMEIIRSVDPRPAPPSTLTLWHEGAELLKTGKLEVPAGVISVFADHPLTQEMKDDFRDVPRTPERPRGFYYHVAVWSMGPHLVQGPSPEKISRIVNEVAAKGDTAYAILNVSNLREHVMGTEAWTRQVWNPSLLSTDDFLDAWCPAGTAPLYRRLLEAIPVRDGWSFYDGSARFLIERLLCREETGRPLVFKLIEEREQTQYVLETARAVLDELLREAPRALAFLRGDEAAFVTANLIVQASILRGLYAALSALLDAEPRLSEAAAALQSILTSLPKAETGRWQHWYRGDSKMGIAALLTRIQSISKTRNSTIP